MIEIFRDKNGKGVCALCDGEIDKLKAHIILEIKGIPPLLFLFHIDHYEIFVGALAEYIKKNESPIIVDFVELNKYHIREENKIAIDQGIEYEFERDLREVMTFKAYKEIVKTLEEEYSCKVLKRVVTVKECFSCYHSGVICLCSRTFFFSIKPNLRKFKSQEIYSENLHP